MESKAEDIPRPKDGNFKNIDDLKRYYNFYKQKNPDKNVIPVVLEHYFSKISK